jgi:threonyl-tRNA synthetase
MQLDAEFNADGTVRKPAQNYYLKPMNCPFHNLIYKSTSKSYRDLPLRFFEFGSVYRYEKSGVIHGLTRVRGMTQDDAHIYTTLENMAEELDNLLKFVLNLLKDYGLDDFYLELSTKNSEKSVGTDAEWVQATETLRKAAEAQNIPLVMDEGGAAFYGPKISVQAKDALGRTWQMSTIQLDFQLPQKFELEFKDKDGSVKRPVMIHRALFGSIERFFGVLLEHYAGAFPPWLAPVQVVCIPIADTHIDYLKKIETKLKAKGVRVEIDSSDDRMQKKIRTAQTQKVPFMLIAGDQDVSAHAVSFRFRDGTQENSVSVDDAIKRPVMIHRALFGSIERFFGVLLEHYAGAFPPWLAPVQVVCIPIADTHIDYLTKVTQKLRSKGVRVEIDASDDRMQKKIRTAQTQKVPFMLIAGDQDVSANAVSFRFRDGTQENSVSVDDAVKRIIDSIDKRIQV